MLASKFLSNLLDVQRFTSMALITYSIVVASVGGIAITSYAVLGIHSEPPSTSVSFPIRPASQVHFVPEASKVSFDNNPFAVDDMTFDTH